MLIMDDEFITSKLIYNTLKGNTNFNNLKLKQQDTIIDYFCDLVECNDVSAKEFINNLCFITEKEIQEILNEEMQENREVQQWHYKKLLEIQILKAKAIF